MPQAQSRSWVLILFGLPFAGIGIGMLVMSVIPTLYEWSRMKSWVEVDARLLEASLESHSGDDSTTYNARAVYEYSFAGQPYRNDRVAINSGSDNIGDFQQQLGRRLEQAYASERAISIWVNPTLPAEAVIDRSLRWGLLGFKMIFALVFGLVGIGIILAGFWGSPARVPHPEASTKPWMTQPAWADNKIYSNQKASVWGGWIFAGIWNLISLPVAVALIPQEFAKGNYIVLIALVFPLVGVWLLYWAVGATRDWKRFGNIYLILDPFPGSIGGHVGASIDLPVIYNERHHFNVVLNCLQKYQSGSGKNRETREKLIWQAEGLAQVHPSSLGENISFRFDIPSGLPASEPEDSEHHFWRVDIENKELGFSRSFEIPVYATGQQSRSLLADAEEHPQMRAVQEALIEKISDLEQIPGGIRLYFPMLRNLSLGMMLTIIGAIFAGAGILIYRADASVMFLLVFGGIGLLMFLSGVYILLNSLRVELDRQGLRSWRFWLAIPLNKREIPRGEIVKLVIKESYSSQSNGKHQVTYSIKAMLRNGKQITVADSLHGRATAEHMLETLGLLTGYPV